MSDSSPVPRDPAALKEWVSSLSREELADLAGQLLGGSMTGGLAGLAVERRRREIRLTPPPPEPGLLTVAIELVGSKPRIWRRLALPGDLTLDRVHPLLQAAMGWTDSHLHHFQPGIGRRYDEPYFLTEFDVEEGDEGVLETEARIDQVLRDPGDRMLYLYDFGDGWEHRLTLESVSPLTPETRQPACLAGARACPPEDVGGIHGHHELAVWLRAGASADAVPAPFEDAAQAWDWLPVDYDPDAFDVEETTAAMRRWAAGEHLPWHRLPTPAADLMQRLRGEGYGVLAAWLSQVGPREPVALEEAQARQAARPWRAVLDAVGPGVRLTSAGYLPPAVVEEIAHRSEVSDWWIGKANREDLTPPVLALRDATQRLGLLRKAKGSLAPTARARTATATDHALVAAVLERLPLGSGFEAEAGWCAIVALAAGTLKSSLSHGLVPVLTDLGWRHRNGSPLSATEAVEGAQPTIEILELMAGGQRMLDADLLTTLARATLFGVAPS
ncbi:plasmid pRiA4b ORF-3 family protein [Nostocoides sp. Soil756]|jgi:hypothetical protein|uniref:plasmid pRiA4b ORF-3 family protein n=1 Tax=Nostocoides sp. Soil756 TaxID=1736399 RepID=UPI0006FD2215|nr:plasmid pRiA4b ORF-3 family protein [Tetrasphaera sp. Soil756]KRE62947.1 hypothetical protein ASG78_08285 [Tetrasphaera sp. Soil756]